MDRNKLYFRSVDDTFCETLGDLLDDAELEGLSELTIVEALPDNETKDFI